MLQCAATMQKSVGFNEMPSGVGFNPFRAVEGCARLPWFRRGLRFTLSLRIGVVFLADRTSVHMT